MKIITIGRSSTNNINVNDSFIAKLSKKMMAVLP